MGEGLRIRLILKSVGVGMGERSFRIKFILKAMWMGEVLGSGLF